MSQKSLWMLFMMMCSLVMAVSDTLPKPSAAILPSIAWVKFLSAELSGLYSKNQTPSNGSSLPIPVEVIANDISGAKKVDLYAQSSDGSTRLISSDIAPQNNVITLQWTSNLGAGNYIVFAVITDSNGNTHPGPSIKIKLTNE
jgi:hypothetical protein